jgi:hypothetical protein
MDSGMKFLFFPLYKKWENLPSVPPFRKGGKKGGFKIAVTCEL